MKFAGYLQLLANRSFLLLWLGQSVSSLGDAIYRIALVLLVTTLSSSPLALMAVVGAQTGIGLLVGPLAGVLADRYPRRRLMLIAALVRLVAVLMISQAKSMWVLIPLVLVMSAAAALSLPARQALIPDLVGEKAYLSAASLSETTESVVGLVGPLLGGVLVSQMGLGAAFLMDAASFVLSAGVLLLLGRSMSEKARVAADTMSRVSLGHQFREGIKVVAGNSRVVFLLAVLLPVMVALGALNVLQADYVNNQLGASPRQYGLVESSMFAGSLLLTLITGLLAQRLNKGKLLISSVGLIGVATAVFLWEPNLPIVYCWAFCLGASDGLLTLPFYGILVEEIPAEARGRAMSGFMAMMRVGLLLGLGLAGLAAARLGSGRVIGLAGLLVLAISLMARLHPQYAALCAATAAVSDN